ncbi:MAG: DMT family transporter [Proteobacteria bacterium]|nr:DMT family transporter [Pseudomonadota bacterium]
MRKLTMDWLLALSGGLLLALMIDYNSLMAKHSTPLFASWTAHGVGTITSLFFIVLFSKLILINKEEIQSKSADAPVWSYLGGIPGALTVVLAAVTVNTTLGLSGTLSLMLVGQIIFGMISDRMGLFGMQKRELTMIDFLVILCVLSGSCLIIFNRS